MNPLARLHFPAQFLDTFESFALSRGVDRATFWQDGPFTSAAAAEQLTMLTGDCFLALMIQARHYADPDHPLSAQLLAHMPLTTFGSLGVVVIASPTLDAALEAALRFYPLVMPACEIWREESPEEVRLVFRLTADFSDFNDTLLEMLLGTFNTVRRHLRPDIGLLDIHCHHRQGFPLERYSYFADPQRLRFEQTANRLILPRRYLDLSLDNASRATLAQFRETLEEQIRQLHRQVSVTQLVRDQLRHRLQRGELIDQGSIAEGLHLSSRSLCRHLAAEQQQFRQLALEARLTLAAELLRRSQRPISHIARAAGFRNDSSFSRSFQRFHGVSPKVFRSG